MAKNDNEDNLIMPLGDFSDNPDFNLPEAGRNEDEIIEDTAAVSIEKLSMYDKRFKQYLEERFPIFFCTDDEDDIKNTINSASLNDFWLIVKVPANIVQTDSLDPGEYPIMPMKFVSSAGGQMAIFYIVKNPWKKGGTATYTSNPIGSAVYCLNISWYDDGKVDYVDFWSQTI